MILSKKQFVFCRRIRILQILLNLLITFPRANHSPKDGVVQIVDMTINLSPPKIVLEAVLVGINNNSAIESWYFSQLNLKKLGPIEHIG